MEKWTKYCDCGKYIDHLDTFRYKDIDFFYCWYCKRYFDHEGNAFPFEDTFRTTFDEIKNKEDGLKNQERNRLRKEEEEIALAKHLRLEGIRIKELEEEKRNIEVDRQRRLAYARKIIATNIQYFYHLTSKKNIVSILRNGILSKNQVIASGIAYANLSWDGCQAMRDMKSVDLSDGTSRDVHDLTPAYFIYKTPNNFRMWQQDKEVVLICITKKILDAGDCCYAFSDGNLANNDTRTYSNLADMDQLDWTILHNSFVDYADHETKRKRMSEILIYPKVDTKFIEKLIVPSHQLKIEIDLVVRQEGLTIPVEQNFACFG